MPTKTKTELEAEIRDLKAQLDAKHKEELFDEGATQIHNLYKSFVKAGFTEEQAWVLTRDAVNNANIGTKSNKSIF
jgi:hypothetical protein